MTQPIRKCKQCGEIKQLSKQFFRPYYGKAARGFYRVCKTCESINNRYKYLTSKYSHTDAESTEIQQIEALYEVLKGLGLEPPSYGQGNVSTVSSLVDELLKKKQDVQVPHNNSAELQHWLTTELTEEPEYYDDIYFTLRKKYMPVIGMNADSTLQHDETHKETLERILIRFDEYEDNYYTRDA